MSEFHFGVHFPAGQQRSSNVGDYARRVDALGYDSIWLIENLGSGSPGLECLTTLGYLAASAPRLMIGTSVMLLPLRNPVVVAQAAATLQVLTGGKFIFGVGVGASEHSGRIGVDPSTRGRRCEESLEVMRKLWTGEPVTYRGELVNIDNYTLGPVPETAPTIWIGGHSGATERRAGRHADGYIPIGVSPGEYADLFSRLDQHSQAHGRSDKLTRAIHCYLGFAPSVEEALAIGSEVASERYRAEVTMSNPVPHLLGSPEDCLRTLQAYRAAGVTHFVFDPVCRAQETEAQVERLMKEVIEPFRSTS